MLFPYWSAVFSHSVVLLLPFQKHAMIIDGGLSNITSWQILNTYSVSGIMLVSPLHNSKFRRKSVYRLLISVVGCNQLIIFQVTPHVRNSETNASKGLLFIFFFKFCTFKYLSLWLFITCPLFVYTFIYFWCPKIPYFYIFTLVSLLMLTYISRRQHVSSKACPW